MPPVCRFALLFLLMAAGCHSGKPLLPQGWMMSRVVEPATRPTAEGGVLQVIICYGAGLSNHSAVRIESPDEATLFWDPGGRFGTVPPRHERVRCLVVDRPPTLAQYWQFRTDFCAERWMEVFEWDLTEAKSKQLAGVLLDGRFDTDYVGLGCALGVSDFLSDTCAAGIRIRGRYFLPHSLAADLWHQHPSRVWEYRLNDGVFCVRPPRPDGQRAPQLAK